MDSIEPHTAVHWYALRSKPNKEMTLFQEVRARGVECYYPCLRVQPVNPRSRTMHPYFPGYVFVCVDLERSGFSAFQWLPFSLGLVSFGGEPAAVPHGLVHAIRQRVDEINAAGGEQLRSFKPGEAVMISDGPFTGYNAVFDAHISGNERVRVLLKILQVRKEMPLELPAAQIQPIKRS